jgi:cellulose synthase/poly-beta-1,6-N-acetylglucosamine synthase-like glycosyltransferase
MIDVIGVILFAISITVFLWAFYNIPILVAGAKNLYKSRHKTPTVKHSASFMPTFSIIVPVKNEEKVVSRLLTTLSKLNYPAEKKEIIIVEDGSTDNTLEVCNNYAKENKNVKILHRALSTGKASALNYGISNSTGEIIALFDADNIPDANALNAVCESFDDPNIAAVQGQTSSLNAKQNMLTQFIAYEEALWCEVYLRGKDVLNLFVHLKGSCQFIRRDVLEKLHGFDENFMSEDVELSARLAENGYKIKYASNVISWQESPSNFKALFKQRTRWFRGITEIAFKYGRLMAKFSLKNLDAEATFFAPFILIFSLLPYIASFCVALTVFPFNILWTFGVQFAMLTTTVTLLLFGFALAYVSKPRRVKNVLWLPFIYIYWTFQAFIAIYALLLMSLRRPKQWAKTERTGIITNPTANNMALGDQTKIPQQ